MTSLHIFQNLKQHYVEIIIPFSQRSYLVQKRVTRGRKAETDTQFTLSQDIVSST